MKNGTASSGVALTEPNRFWCTTTSGTCMKNTSATVTAVSDVLAYALDRESFLVAVTGHARTTTAADSVITSRFEELRELGLVANED